MKNCSAGRQMSTLFPWTIQLHSKKHRWDYNTEIKCWVCFLWIKLHLNIKQFPQIAYLSLILFFNMYELCVIRCLMTCQTHRCYADVFKRVVGQISRTRNGGRSGLRVDSSVDQVKHDFRLLWWFNFWENRNSEINNLLDLFCSFAS